ncbi:hypothetical protein L1049_013920 [Liquidambar formosana]|uniref:Uncharacterized protein n=1 Tax=Liquidambar formosana TaxID=63359 RepID=A0AAP0RM51_LIQFO
MACNGVGKNSLYSSCSSNSSLFQYPTYRRNVNHNQVVVMRICTANAATFPSLGFPKLITRKRSEVIEVRNTNLSESNVKKAYLFARRKERIKLPNYDVDSGDKTYHISEFLCHPSGVKAILNTKALQSFQSVDSNMYRCTLPGIQL